MEKGMVSKPQEMASDLGQRRQRAGETLPEMGMDKRC